MTVDTTEAALLQQIVELAEQWLGYRTVHFRPARTAHGWRTPVQGSMGKGWPDLMLARPGRLIAAELKAGKGQATQEQMDVLAWLARAGVETYIWRPEDWERIVEVLR